MRGVLPGRAQAKLQAVCIGTWDSQALISYISGNALVILKDYNQIIQTIYHDDGKSLEAVAFDEGSGKIATCSRSEVYIYKPYGKDEGALKWALQGSSSLNNIDDIIHTLSWGSEEELLAGSRKLHLFATSDSLKTIWVKEVSSPIKLASFSYDADLLATTSQYDRLVKIWRRLSYGSDEIRFDSSYLHHPQTVTGLHWRRPFHRDQTIDNVLYTLCADNLLRIWASKDPHGLQVLQLCGQINLLESIQPRLDDGVQHSSKRYAFMIDSRDFTLATQSAVAAAVEKESQHAMDHLIEVANRNPEICIVLDEFGRMSAWGIENVGSKSKKATNIFNVAYIEDLPLAFAKSPDTNLNYVQIHNFCRETPGASLTILAHHFDGRIEWIQAKIDELFDPSPRQHRWIRKSLWTGHSSSISKIVRSNTGQALFSRTNSNSGILWKKTSDISETPLKQQSILESSEHIHRTCILGEGAHVVFLHHKRISLWDATQSFGSQMADRPYTLQGKPLCLILLPEVEVSLSLFHVATISSEMKGIVWEISLPKIKVSSGGSNGYSDATILRELCVFDLGIQDNIDFVLPVDPAGSVALISGFVDKFARDVAVSYTTSGVIRTWTARVDVNKQGVEWLLTSTVESGIEHPSLASATSIRKTALVDSERTGLTIWDSRSAQLEFEEIFETRDVIRDLDWTSTPDNQSVLAVGFSHRVLLMSQLRYDYINKGSAWAVIREIRIRDLTPHPIGDSIWLSGGEFVIGSGNQLFIYDQTIETMDGSSFVGMEGPTSSLFSVVSRLNGTLPIFHPQFLGQCILSGKASLVQRILVNLNKALKFFTDGDELDSFLGMSLREFTVAPETTANMPRKELHSSYAEFEQEDETEVLDENLALALNEKLAVLSIPQLSRPQQLYLADVVECAATVEKHRRSMDANAYRFLLFFRQHMLRSNHRSSIELNISWREMIWAFHSESQDILTDLVSKQFQGALTWEHAKESGMFMWIRDISAVRAQFEIVARNQYTSTDEKNPIDCSLHYLALKKKNVLMGLWRMAGWNREQRSTQKLLANNFQETRWKTAALKNAYALLGKHRFEYAAAFFLLADCLKDAVNVCANQMDDLQLAVTIARVYDGDDSNILAELLEDRVLPEAARDGNRWLATWAFWMLNKRDKAVRALISPVYTLLDTPETPKIESKLFLSDDPALVVLYQQLREKTLQTLQGASKISPRAEWDFVIRNARMYDRMGCDLLALDLVRNWEFLLHPPDSQKSIDNGQDPRSVLRRRSSLVVADLSSPKLGPGGKGTSLKPPPSVFEEPSGSSLLDSFGF